MLDNTVLIEWTKDITIAAMSDVTYSPDKQEGEDVAEFMQVIYDKLTEFSNKY